LIDFTLFRLGISFMTTSATSQDHIKWTWEVRTHLTWISQDMSLRSMLLLCGHETVVPISSQTNSTGS